MAIYYCIFCDRMLNTDDDPPEGHEGDHICPECFEDKQGDGNE